MSVCCGVVSVLWWVSVVREWVAGFNTVYVWVGLWVDRFVVVGVGLVDFFFLCCGLWWWWWWLWLWLWLCVWL